MLYSGTQQPAAVIITTAENLLKMKIPATAAKDVPAEAVVFVGAFLCNVGKAMLERHLELNC